jgi:hypothetical protein
MVSDMENLEEIRGYLTFGDEEKKPEPETPADGDQPETVGTIEKLQQEASETVLTVDGDDILEKFKSKVIKEFLPCELLAQHANEQFLEYLDFD